MIPDSLAAALAGAGDRLGGFRERIRWYPEVDSTNDIAMTLAETPGAAGAVVIADAQRKGRGRRGRIWFSPPGAGVYASVVLPPPAAVVSFLPLAAGLAVAEGIEAATGLRVGVKWPNDVYVPGPGGLGRKLAGVLAEAGGSDSRPSNVVVGFGINVLRSVFPPDVADRGTSLETELGRPVDGALVLVECLASLWRRYRDLHDGRVADVADAWRARATDTIGRRVEWDAGGRAASGTATGIDQAGALLVRTESGTARVIAGEVRWY